MPKILITNESGKGQWFELQNESNIDIVRNSNDVALAIKEDAIVANMIAEPELITGPTGAAGSNGVQGATGDTGPKGEAFFIDDNGELNDGFATNPAFGSPNDFYLWLVTDDIRTSLSLPGIGTKGVQDLSRHVIMYNGTQWYDYGEFTGLQGPAGSNGAIGATGVTGSTGATGSIGATGPTGLQGSVGAGGALGYWGSFWSTVTQYNSDPVEIKSFTVNNADPNNNGITVVDSSKITFAHAGVYNIQFSAQLAKSDSGDDNIEIWINKNGNPISETNTHVTLTGNSAKQVAAWNFLINLNANDYIELKWYSADTGMYIHAESGSTGPTRPAIPSIILTTQQVMYTQLGPTGATGPTGAAGSNGSNGAAGATGATGVDTSLITINGQTGTTYTLQPSDKNKLIILSNASAIALTVPANSATPIAIGTQIMIAQGLAGNITISGAGVILRSAGSKLTTNVQYSGGTLIKTDTDTWYVFGDLK